MGQLGVGRLDRGDQGVDHLVLDEVGQVARGDRPREAAPTVLDLLVLGQRVGDQREGRDVVASARRRRTWRPPCARRRPCPSACAAPRCWSARRPRRESASPPWSRRTAAPRRRARPHASRAAGTPARRTADAPGRPGGRAARAGSGPAPGSSNLASRTASSSRFSSRVKNSRVGRDRRRALLHVLIEAAGRRVADVAGMDQLGVAHDPPEGLLQLLVGRDRRRQVTARRASPAGPGSAP